MEDNISEREQLDEIKKWWAANGKAIIAGLVLGLAALFGYRYWQDVQNSRAESASINYQQFLKLAANGPSDDVRKTGQAIIDGDKSSVYARLTALLLARLAVDDNKLDEAKKHLEWVVANNPESELASIARSRLAQLLLAKGDATAALAILNEVKDAGSKRLFAETRGDVFAALGKNHEAHAMYGEAIADLVELGGDPTLLEIKQESLALSDDTASAD